MDNKWCLYVHTVPKEISGHPYDKYYVGITSQKPEARWGCNGCRYKNIHFYNAIHKYGWNNIKHEIVFSNLSKAEAEQKEIEYIAKLKSNYKEHGYNISPGGDGGNRKPTTPVKQYTLDGTFVREWASASEAARTLGIDRTFITRSAKHRKKTHGFMFCYANEILTKPYKRINQRTVCKFDMDGSFLCAYNSVEEASKIENIGKDSILKCVSHKNKTAFGYKWEYEDYLLEKGIMYICGI